MEKTKVWHPVEFAGIWMLMDEPFYEGKDQLNADYVGESDAARNANLASKAPQLRELLNKMAEYYIHDKKISEFDFEEMQLETIKILKELV